MSTAFVNPHIYKKGKIIHFKKLDKEDNSNTRYLFKGATPASLTSISNLGNNLNQVMGRCLIGFYKLLSYFGLSKDPSEQFSKHRNVYEKFYSFLEGGGGDDKALETLEEIKKELLNKQNARLDLLVEKNDFFSRNRNEFPISRKEVLDFISKINEIEEYIKKILG